jgi:V/A-type H+-transporting ATPase subunit I
MIEKMHKLIFVGPQDKKDDVLKHLQQDGVVELRPLQMEQRAIEINRSRSEHIKDTYNFLREYKARYEQTSTEYESEEEEEVCDEICPMLQNYKKRLYTLRSEEQHIRENIKKAIPWGRFDLNLIKETKEMGNTNIQFWITSERTHFDDCQIPEEIIVEEINHVNKRKYFITFFFQPVNLEHCEEVIFEEDLTMLENDLANNLKQQEELEKAVIAYVPYIEAINEALRKELNSIAYEEASASAGKALDGKLFVLQGWCPGRHLERVKKKMKDVLVELIEIEPEPYEKVPTLMINNKIGSMGSDLVNIYDTPSYKDWDPSTWVFFSFTIFFAMIMADGGYGLLLLLIMLIAKFKLKNTSPSMKRFINMSLILSGATVAYGLASGGFFGLSTENRLFGWLVGASLFDPLDIDMMMNASIIIGMIHVTISLILKAVRLIKVFKDYITPISNVAWIAVIWSFYFWYGYSRFEAQPFYEIRSVLLTLFIVALVAVFLTTGGTFKPVKLIVGGLLGLYNIVQFFSDILSYLRLFALGMAGTLLAQTFNSLASDVMGFGVPGIILAVIIFIIGHTINILLCVMGGVIHGLRLNFLEWYRWSFDGDGRAFKPFRLITRQAVE